MAMSMNHWIYQQLLPQLPKKWLSHFVGKAAHFSIPAGLNRQLVKTFANHYKIDLNEIEKPFEDYHSLGEFFSRRLKEGARPIQGDVVHPCDGLLIESGKIHDELLIQAKGKSFSLQEFLPENPWEKEFKKGSFFTYYLAPHNYHRVHAPVSGNVNWSTLVPGELWPVNSWSVKNIEGLYAVNERVVSGIQAKKGKVIMVMVGATNVGSMSFSFDPNIKTNNPRKKENVHRTYEEGRPLSVGDDFGAFHLGSTVVLLFDESWNFHHIKRQKVLMGERFPH